jgi:hypothetical protein
MTRSREKTKQVSNKKPLNTKAGTATSSPVVGKASQALKPIAMPNVLWYMKKTVSFCLFTRL